MSQRAQITLPSTEELSTLYRRVAELETALAESRQSETLLRLQHEVSLALSSTDNLTTALHLLLATIIKIEGIDCGGVYLVDEASGALDLAAHCGLSAEFIAVVSHYEADAANTRLVQAGLALYQDFADFPSNADSVTQREGLRALGVIPIAYEGRVIAALNASSHTHDQIPWPTRHALETLAFNLGGLLARLKAETSLQTSQENLQALFDTMDEFVFILDWQGRILKVNPVVQQRLGYLDPEPVGRSVLEVHPPERRAEAAAIVAEVLAGRLDTCLIPLITTAGTLIPVETKVTRGTWNNQPALFGISRDITERQHMQEALQASEASFRLLFANNPLPMWVYDRQTLAFLEVNEAAIDHYGYSRDEFLHMNALDIRTLEEGARLLEYMRRSHPDLRRAGHWQHRLKDGRFIEVEINSHVINFAGREAALVVAQDITERKQAEEKLRASELRFRQLAENIDQVFWIFDTKDIVYISPAYEAIWDRTCQSLYDQSFSFMEGIHPADQVRLNQAIEQQLQGQPTEIEYRVVQPDGSIRWVMDRGFPILNEQGQVYLVAGIAADITARRQAELELRQRTQEYQTLVENIPDIIQRFDRSLRFTYVNSAITKIFGLPVDFVIGKSYGQIGVPPEQLQILEKAISQVFAMGQAQAVILWYPRYDVYYQTYFVPEFGADGVVETVLAIGRDVTELKQAQAAVEGLNRTLEARVQERTTALQESEARYRLLSENSHDMIALHDADRTLRYVSQSVKEILGYEPEELIGISPFELLHPDEIEEARRTSQRQAELNGVVENLEARLRRKDGSYIWIETRTRPIFDASGQVAQLQSSSRDISARKQIEVALRQSEERYRAIAESFPGGAILELDRDLRILLIEGSELKSIGLTKEELVGRRLSDILGPESMAYMEPYFRRAWAGEVVNFEAHEFNGAYTVYVSPLFGADQQIGRLLVVSYNITARKQAEAALQASEAQYRALVENSLLGVAIVQGEHIVFANQALAEMMGLAVAELLALSPEGVMALVHPHDQNEVQKVIRALLMGEIKASTQEFRFVQPNGNIRWAVSAATLISRQGQPAIQASYLDITLLKQAEQALRASEQRFREIFELSPVGIFISTVEGGITRANAALCTMLGYTEEELQAKMIFELIHPDDLAVDRPMFEPKLLRGETVYFEQRYLSKSGKVIWGNVAGKMISGETGQSQYGLGIITNITGRKEIEEALRRTAEELSAANAELGRAARLKDEFLASMSHELRTPLTAILGQSEVLEEQIYGPLNEEQRHALSDIQTSGQHLLALINDLLDLSKIEAGKLELDLRPVSVAGVCQASLRLIKNQAHKKELTVTFTQDETAQVLQADERRLKQILVNLLSNAVKFTPEGGQIGLEVVGDTTQKVVYFTVWDTGIGIATEHIERLFKPFVQLDSRLSRQYTGTGLGLSLVARLSQMHGGKVSLESTVGQGSRFTVTLPWSGVSQHQMMQTEKSGPEAPKDKAPAQLIETGVILVAEDNEQVLQVLLQYLQVGGYRTAVARDGREALAKAAAIRPGLILMDIQMPGLDGLETIRRLRAEPDEGLAQIPIIALTALATPEDRGRCLAAGANAFLSKPARLKELLKTIEGVLTKTTPSPA